MKVNELEKVYMYVEFDALHRCPRYQLSFQRLSLAKIETHLDLREHSPEFDQTRHVHHSPNIHSTDT